MCADEDAAPNSDTASGNFPENTERAPTTECDCAECRRGNVGDCLLVCLNLFVLRDLMPWLHKRCRCLLTDEGTLEEIVTAASADVWMLAREKWIVSEETARMPSNVRRARLCRAAYNLVRNALRRRRRGPLGRAVPVCPEHVSISPLEEFDPYAAQQMEDDITLLRLALAEIDDDEQRLLAIRYIDGLSLREAAEILGCARTTVMRRSSTIIERLRARLASLGFPDFSA
jgi:RNA polymerase sigma factor (sigma-70 family)